MRRLALGLSTLALSVGLADPAGAQFLRDIGGAPAIPGDDNNTPAFYGFDVNFFGVTNDVGVVCTNGYLILGGFAPAGNCAYPGPLGGAPSTPDVPGLVPFYGQVMAPFFTDVNLGFPGSGPLLVGTGMADGRLAWGATWDAVSAWNHPFGSTVTFQLALLDNGGGNFTMEFNYGQLDWAADGGIGFGDEEAGAFVFPADRRPFSRYSCDFVDGVVAGCAFSTVPEPTTVALLGGGLLGLLGVGAHRRRRATLPTA